MQVIVYMKESELIEFPDVKGAQPSADGQWFLITENGKVEKTTVFNRQEMLFVEISADLIQVPPTTLLAVPR